MRTVLALAVVPWKCLSFPGLRIYRRLRPLSVGTVIALRCHAYLSGLTVVLPRIEKSVRTEPRMLYSDLR